MLTFPLNILQFFKFQESNSRDLINPCALMKHRIITGVILILVVFLLFPNHTLVAQPLPEKLPWTLRNHYTFRTATGSILYCEEDAAWTLNDKTGTPVVEEVGFSVTLGSGTIIRADHLERADAHRVNFDHERSPGTNFNVVFPPLDGLQINHSITSFKDRGFQMITLRVDNVSQDIIPIQKLNPVVFQPGAVHLRDTTAKIHHQNVHVRGGSPIFDQGQQSMLTLFHEPDREILLAMGILPRGEARSGIDFQPHGGTWMGEISCVYEPNYPLKPGESLVSDAIWLSFGDPDRDNVDLNYSWFFSTLGTNSILAKAPPVWIAVQDNEGLDTLLRQTEAWRPYGIRHALIPGNWEGIPGSLEGATPLFPRNMAQAAKSLRDAKVSPGIIIDPLTIKSSESSGVMLSDDGQAWLNLSDQNALALYESRIKTILGWGFDFIVIEASHIPDSLLVKFNMTRSQADHLAFTHARSFAADKSILPTASLVINPEILDWNNVGRIIKHMSTYAVTPGPVRLQADSLNGLSTEIVESMRAWPGPVELMGSPNSRNRQIYETLFAAR